MTEEELNNPAYQEAKREYLKLLHDDFKYSIDKFDSQALFISSGALGLSLAFVKDLVPFNKAIFTWIFLVALWSFVLAIIIGFIAHYRSSKAIARQIELVDSDKLEESNVDNSIHRINKLLIGIIFLGIFTLVLFVTININNMSKVKGTGNAKEITIIDSSTKGQMSIPVRSVPKNMKPSDSKPSSGKGGKK